MVKAYMIITGIGKDSRTEYVTGEPRAIWNDCFSWARAHCDGVITVNNECGEALYAISNRNGFIRAGVRNGSRFGVTVISKNGGENDA